MHSHLPAGGEAGTGHLPKRSLAIAIMLTSVIFLAEVAGGLVSGSLSLLGDAAHMLQDIAALFISLGAVIIAERLPTPRQTFGYHRVEIAAAALNGLVLMAVSGVIVYEALARFSRPGQINSTVMFSVAVAGLSANLVCLHVLHGSHDLNVRSAFLHVLGDTLSSVAVIAAALWIACTGQTIVDPLLSIAIAILILVSSFPLLRDACSVLLQFAPRDVSTKDVIREMESVDGVGGVHNVHLWSLCSNINVLDAHVLFCETDTHRQEEIKTAIKHRLEKYRIGHSTLEFECRACGDCRIIRDLRD